MANFKWYGSALTKLLTGQIDFDTDTFNVMLTTSAYVPNQDAHDFRDDVTNEIAGTGYTAGGQVLAGVTVTYDAATNEARVLWTDSVWTNATFTARNAIIYKARGGLASADELIAFLTFDADASATAAPFTLDYTTSVLKLTAAA